MELWQRWSFARVCIDASGIGAGLADFLASRRPERVEKFVFSAPSKSRLAFNMLAMINTGKLSVYKGTTLPSSPPAPLLQSGRGDGQDRLATSPLSSLEPELAEFWREAQACRYWLRASETMGWGVPEREGHDDFVVSLALTVRATEGLAPPPASALIRALPDGESSGW
jgi:pimeloyl-ACP methyl ester carboxylesterase